MIGIKYYNFENGCNVLISVDIFHCDNKTNHSPPLDLCSTCHTVLITVELIKGLSELTRLAELFYFILFYKIRHTLE